MSDAKLKRYDLANAAGHVMTAWVAEVEQGTYVTFTDHERALAEAERRGFLRGEAEAYREAATLTDSPIIAQRLASRAQAAKEGRDYVTAAIDAARREVAEARAEVWSEAAKRASEAYYWGSALQSYSKKEMSGVLSGMFSAKAAAERAKVKEATDE